MNCGSEDRLAQQNLRILEGLTNRTIPEWLFSCRFPTQLSLPASCPNATIVKERPTKKETHLVYTLGMHYK